MPKPTRRQFLITLPAAAAETSPGWVLWYRQPAGKWTDALPVGNGRLGAMVFGGVETERLSLNQDTLWSGYKRDWNNPDAKNYLPEVRRLALDQENYAEADKVCRKMQGPYNQSYLPLADLHLKFEHEGAVADYRRELDLDAAIARVGYRAGGARFTREVFSSAPDQAIVVRLTADQPAKLDFTISLDSPLRHTTTASGRDTLRLSGKAPAHVDPNYFKSDNPIVYDDAPGKGMNFEGRLEAIAEGGGVEAAGNPLPVRGATAVTLLFTAATGAAAGRRTYAELRERHIALESECTRRRCRHTRHHAE